MSSELGYSKNKKEYHPMEYITAAKTKKVLKIISYNKTKNGTHFIKT